MPGDDLEMRQDTPVRARIAIGTVVQDMHRRSSQAPIRFPDEYGAFGDAGFPTVFPMVIDANALRDELLYTVRKDQRTILCNAANGGVLRLFCAAHVIDEVYAHVAEWAAVQGLDAGAVLAVWETSYLPLLRCVAIPEQLTTARENARLAVLADATSPYGDPDDVPSATLALLLGAPLLSKDANPLRAVYGAGFDHVAHAQWLRALAAGGDLGPLSLYMQGTTMFANAVGYGSYAAIRGLLRRVPWPWLVAVSAAAIGLGSRLIAPEDIQRARAGIGRVLVSALELFAEVTMLHSAAELQFKTLAAPAPSWDEVANDLGARQALMRYCLHELARCPSSNLSAVELRERLELDESVPQSEAKVRAVLRTGSCFEQVYRGRFQVGAALVRDTSDRPTTAS